MLFTIITVTFNAAQWLERTLKSVLSQQCLNYNYLIIDGASTDQTINIAQQYQPAFNGRMHIVSEPDKGLYDAMNKAIQKAEGQYLWFINAGDEIYSNNTLTLLEQAATTKPDIIYGQAVTSNEKGESVGQYHKTPPEQLTRQSLLNGLVVCHQAFLIKRSIATPYNLNYHIAADYDWVIQAVEKAGHQVYVQQPLCRFLVNGLSQRNPIKAWKERFTIMKRHFGLCATLIAHLKIAFNYLIRKAQPLKRK